MSAIKDPESDTEYCLDCMQKHLSIASVRLGEVAERGKEDSSDPKINKKLRSIMGQLAEAAEHINEAHITDDQERAVVSEIGKEVRRVRDTLRNYKKTGDQTLFQNAVSQISKIEDGVETAIQKFGCETCQVDNDKLAAIKKQLTTEIKPVSAPKELSTVSTNQPTNLIRPLIENLFPKSVDDLPLVSELKKEVILLPTMVLKDLATILLFK